MRTKTEAEKFFSKMFEMRDTFHFTHLAQLDEKYSTHIVLQEMYDAILPIIDGIVEGYIGETGDRLIISCSASVTENPVEYVSEKIHYININSKIFNSWIVNELDNIVKILAIGLYKLKYVK